MKTLEIKWTVSRGRDTAGYNVVTLYDNGTKAARCNGGGYDMEGTVLGSWLARTYSDRLMALKAEDMPEQSHFEADQSRFCEGECKASYQKALMDAIGDGSESLNAFEKSIALPKLPYDCFECPACKGQTRTHWNEGKTIQDGRYFYGLTYHDPNYNPAKAVIGKDADDRTLGDGAEGKTVEQAEKDGVSFGLERYQAFYRASSKHPTERHTIPQIDGGCGKSSVEQIAKAIGISLQYVPVKSKKLTIYNVVDATSAATA